MKLIIETAVGITTLFITLYTTLLTPTINKNIENIISHPVTIILMYITIVYILTQNLMTGIIVSILFYSIMLGLKELQIEEGFSQALDIL